MKQVLEILHNIRPEFDFSQSSDFIEDGMLDSMDVITLVSDLDNAFQISIEGVDILPENFASLEAICALLHRYGVAA